MQRSKLSIANYAAIFVLCLQLLLLMESDARAATSCSAQGGVTTIGLEWVAQQCIPEEVTDSTSIYYINNMIQCAGSNVSLFAPYGDTQGSPAGIIGFAQAQGYRVFRNKEGSHIVMVHKYYNGLIDGKSMSNYATGQVYVDVFKEGFILPSPTPDCKGEDFNRCPMEQKANSTVNMGTGRLSHSQDLFATMSNQPLALGLSLHYRSLRFAPSSIGNGWSHSYEMSLANAAGGRKVFWRDGKRRIYKPAGAAYSSPRGDYSQTALHYHRSRRQPLHPLLFRRQSLCRSSAR